MGVSGSGRQTPFIPYWLRPLYAAALSPPSACKRTVHRCGPCGRRANRAIPLIIVRKARRIPPEAHTALAYIIFTQIKGGGFI